MKQHKTIASQFGIKVKSTREKKAATSMLHVRVTAKERAQALKLAGERFGGNVAEMIRYMITNFI